MSADPSFVDLVEAQPENNIVNVNKIIVFLTIIPLVSISSGNSNYLLLICPIEFLNYC